VRPGVKDAGLREELVGQRHYPFPCPVPLAAPPQPAIPEAFGIGVEHQQGAKVGRHCMVGEEADDDVAEPISLFADRPTHPPAQFFLDLLELGPHAVAPIRLTSGASIHRYS
jgi:hypothetical protein